MIDIENEIFESCVTLVEVDYPDVLAVSAPVRVPAEFPCLSISEAYNTTDTSRTDSSGETASVVAYDVYTYSNLRTGAKAQAKDIARIVDGFMTSHNFNRTYRSQGATPGDASVYMVRTRYMAGVSDDGTIYRR